MRERGYRAFPLSPPPFVLLTPSSFLIFPCHGIYKHRAVNSHVFPKRRAIRASQSIRAITRIVYEEKKTKKTADVPSDCALSTAAALRILFFRSVKTTVCYARFLGILSADFFSNDRNSKQLHSMNYTSLIFTRYFESHKLRKKKLLIM